VAVVAMDRLAIESLLRLNTTSPFCRASDTLEFVKHKVLGELSDGRFRTDDGLEILLVSLPGPMLNIPPPACSDGLNDDLLFPLILANDPGLKLDIEDEEAIDFCTAAPAA
jgi:hypothetical protein